MEGHQQNLQFAGAMMTIYFLGWSSPQVWNGYWMDCSFFVHISISNCFDSGLGYFDEGIQRSQYKRPNFTNLDSIYTSYACILIKFLTRCTYENQGKYEDAEYNTVKTLSPHACSWQGENIKHHEHIPSYTHIGSIFADIPTIIYPPWTAQAIPNRLWQEASRAL